MAKRILEQDLMAIEALVTAHPEGMSTQEIANALGQSIPRRTLQYRLKYLVDAGRLTPAGQKRSTKYRGPQAEIEISH